MMPPSSIGLDVEQSCTSTPDLGSGMVESENTKAESEDAYSDSKLCDAT